MVLLKSLLLAILISVASVVTNAQQSTATVGADVFEDVIDHSRFDSLWRASKSFGRLNTRGVNSEAYQSYRQALSLAEPSRYLLESRIAFWVNAYLACLMETIHVRAGYRSIIWDSLYLERDTFVVAGSLRTLADIQNELLRLYPGVAIRCFFATGSDVEVAYPSHAVTAKTLKLEMRGQLRKVVRSERNVLFDPAGRVLQLSTLFTPWIDAMIAEAGSVRAWLLPWVGESLAAQLALAGDEVRVVVSDRIDRVRRVR